MLNYITLIFACQFAGEFITAYFEISVPGPVLGMIFLFCFLVFKGKVPDKLANVGDALLTHLSLLFVPAGVGVMLHFELLGDNKLAVGLALTLSTVITVVVTALVMQALSKRSVEHTSEGQ